MGLFDDILPKQSRGFWASIGDNLLGFDDEYDTPGERLGRGLNDTAKAIWNNPMGVAQSVKGDLDNLMFQGGAMQRPADVLGYAAAPMAPGAAALAKNTPNVTNAIRAYHGSPHDFDKFSMDAIGTGEGAQAYGHGLYFAENEGVAKGYRDALANRKYAPGDGPSPLKTAWSLVGGDMSRVSMPTDELVPYVKNAWPDVPDVEIKAAIEEAKGMYQPGSMYEVNINADPAEFLDYDAPLSAQPKNVRSALANADPDMWHPDGGDYDPSETGGVIYQRLVDMGNKQGAIGEHMADLKPAIKSGPKWASEQLSGIPGIKYKDAGSRGAGGDGTRNYVVFDENLIEIVKKYGIAGAASIMGLSAQEVEDRMNAV